MPKHNLILYLKYREIYTFNHLNTSNLINKCATLIDNNRIIQKVNIQLNQENKVLNQENNQLNQENKELNKRIKELENQLTELIS